MPHRTHEELLIFKDERYHSSYQVDRSLKNLDFISCTIDCLHLSCSVVHHLDCLHKEQCSVISIFLVIKLTWLIKNIRFWGLDFRSCLKSLSAQDVKKCVKSLETLRNMFSSSVWSCDISVSPKLLICFLNSSSESSEESGFPIAVIKLKF